MLTENEKQWLSDRKHKTYCRYCNVSKLCANPFASGYSCPLTGNMKEALEFSERVTVKLASWETLPVPCMNDTYCDKSSFICPSCRLKYARLEVEGEMDADRRRMAGNAARK